MKSKQVFSIGGTARFPLPVEIRSIDGYNPTLAISIGGEVTKWIAVQNKLGIIVGLARKQSNDHRSHRKITIWKFSDKEVKESAEYGRAE